jgi:hypothetical protein
MKWDQTGERLYETGVSEVALFPITSTGDYGAGVPWNGVTAINEKPSGAEASPIYANNNKYLNLIGREDFGATLEAYMFPDEFGACNGLADLAEGVSIGQQPRTGFGLCYKTILGNDVKNNDYGYKLHVIYGALAAPSEKNYTTVGDSTEPMTMSWELSTTPVPVTGFKPTACLTLDSTKVDAAKLAEIEKKLYGDESSEPAFMLPDEIKAMLAEA